MAGKMYCKRSGGVPQRQSKHPIAYHRCPYAGNGGHRDGRSGRPAATGPAVVFVPPPRLKP